MGNILSFFKKADERHRLIPKGQSSSNKFVHESKNQQVSERYLEINENSLGSIFSNKYSVQSPLYNVSSNSDIPVFHQLSKREDDATELEVESESQDATSPFYSVESKSPSSVVRSNKSYSDNQDKSMAMINASVSEDIDVDEEHVIVFTSEE